MSRLPISDIIFRYNENNQKLATISNSADLIKLSKEQKKLEPQYFLATKIETAEKVISENEELLNEIEPSEKELIDMTKSEIDEKKVFIKNAEEELLSYLAPSDPRDDNDIILEIRAGAGGDESSLFAADLLRMYTYLCEKLDFNLKIIDSSTSDLKGYKDVTAEVRGDNVFSWFKYEGGVHRVQRVPSTEKQGRIHTSTASVAIMPLIEENNDFKLETKDIEIQTTMASGNGGQSVNTTYSAVKMKHIPTGIEAQSQDQKNQIQNRIKCLAVLTSRVFDHFEQKRLEKEYAERKEQVGTADRSEKIRTYNYPQDRVTDHRYNQNWNNIYGIIDGDILNVVQTIKKIEAEMVLESLQKNK